MANAMMELNTTDAGNNVTYTCNPGYAFPDNDVTKHIRCTPELRWTNVGFTHCEGRNVTSYP